MPKVNLSQAAFDCQVQHIRNFFSKRVHHLYIKAANGEIKSYEEFLDRLHSLEGEQAYMLEPYGVEEELCPKDFELIADAMEHNTPLKEYAYHWLTIYNAIEFGEFDANTLLTPLSDSDNE